MALLLPLGNADRSWSVSERFSILGALDIDDHAGRWLTQMGFFRVRRFCLVYLSSMLTNFVA